MRSVRLWLLATAVLLSGASVSTGAGTASRIVDRTLLCKMTGVGYPDPARILRVGAATYNPSTSDIPSGINVSNGPGTGVAILTGFDDRPYKSYLSHTRPTCSASRARVLLSQGSLSGGAVQFSKGYDCDVPARVLIRVQAVFERPPRMSPNATARGDLVHGYIAVTTFPGRKPIAFASLGGASHKARIFVSKALCKEDS